METPFDEHSSASAEANGKLGDDGRRRQEVVDFFRRYQTHCRAKAPDKPVMLAINCRRLSERLEFYPELLAHCDILCPFGFHRMPPDGLTGARAATILQQLCDQAHAHLWLDLEVFLFGPKRELYPRLVAGLIEDLRRFPNFEKVLCYQFPGLMNAPWAPLKPGGDATVKLYSDYKRFLEQGRQ